MNSKRLILYILIIVLFLPFMVSAESKYLYDVLKDEAESDGLARKYTGEHHDSFTEEPFKDIYYWYGSQANSKNNIIFAGHC